MVFIYKKTKMEKKIIRLTEQDLHQIIQESVNRILNETPLDYDIDNLSGRYSKNAPDEEFNPDDYIDDPYHTPNSFDDDDWIDDDEEMEKDYSWEAFDRQAVAPGVGGYYKATKRGIPSEVDRAFQKRKSEKDWSDNELRRGKRMMNKWVKGERTTDDIEDAL
jgi:hypothetical protein